MKKFAVRLLLLILVGIAAPLNATGLPNGDVETGTLAGWTPSGDVRIAHTEDFGGQFIQARGMEGYNALLGLKQTVGTSPLQQYFTVSGMSPHEISFNRVLDYGDISSRADDTSLSFGRVNDGTSIYDIRFFDLQSEGAWWRPDGDLACSTDTDTIDISPYITYRENIVFSLNEQGAFRWVSAFVAGIGNISGTPPPRSRSPFSCLARGCWAPAWSAAGTFRLEGRPR